MLFLMRTLFYSLANLGENVAVLFGFHMREGFYKTFMLHTEALHKGCAALFCGFDVFLPFLLQSYPSFFEAFLKSCDSDNGKNDISREKSHDERGGYFCACLRQFIKNTGNKGVYKLYQKHR